MSRYGDEEFRELELYLRQAEEDIVRSFGEPSLLQNVLLDDSNSTNNNNIITAAVADDNTVDENRNNGVLKPGDSACDSNRNTYTESDFDARCSVVTNDNGCDLDTNYNTLTESAYESNASTLTINSDGVPIINDRLTISRSTISSRDSTLESLSTHSSSTLEDCDSAGIGHEHFDSSGSDLTASGSETDTVSAGGFNEVDINDILDSYDNVEFYKESTGQFSHVDDQSVASPQKQSASNSDSEDSDTLNANENLNFKHWGTLDKISYKELSGNDSSSKQDTVCAGNAKVGTEVSKSEFSSKNDNIFIENANTEKHCISDPLLYGNDQKILTVKHLEKSVFDEDIDQNDCIRACEDERKGDLKSRSTSWENTDLISNPTQEALEPDTENYMDDLVSCKSLHIHSNRQDTAASGKLASRAQQEVLLQLNHQKSEQSHGSLGGSTTKLPENRSFMPGITEMDSIRPDYQAGDNSKLDNRSSAGVNNSVMESGREIMSQNFTSVPSLDTNISSNSSCSGRFIGESEVSKSQSKSHNGKEDCGNLDLDEFLEEINESIDELISTDKPDRVGDKRNEEIDSDGDLNTVDCHSNGNGNGFTVNNDMILNENRSLLPNEKNAKISVSPENGINDAHERSFKLGDGNNFEEIGLKEDVVETDAGYYWLTCSIEDKNEDENDVTDKQTCDDNVDGESSLSTDKHPIEKDQDKTLKSEAAFESNCTDRFDKTKQKDTKAGVKSKTCTDIDVADAKIEAREPKVNGKERSDKENITNILSLYGDHGDRPIIAPKPKLLDLKFERNSLESASLQNQTLQVIDQSNNARKLSCPENVFKVFKVVSVDIPKLDKVLGSGSVETKSRSWDTLPKRRSRPQSAGRNSLEEKKERILSYLEELSSIGIQTKEEVTSASSGRSDSSTPVNVSKESIDESVAQISNKRKSVTKPALPVKPKWMVTKENAESSNFDDVDGGVPVAIGHNNINNKLVAKDSAFSKHEDYISVGFKDNTSEPIVEYECEHSKDFDTKLEPPVMFQDNIDTMETKATTPILEPPSSFVENVVDVAPAMTSLPVWEVRTATAPSTTSCGWPGQTIQFSGEDSGEAVTKSRKHKHPSTPPPPSVDRTEQLISSTINPYKHRKHSVDASTSVSLLKPPPQEMMRRKSADSGIQSEYVDIDLYQDEENPNNLESTNLGSEVTCNSGGGKDKNHNVTRYESHRLCNGGMDVSYSKSPVELKSMLDLLNSYHSGYNELENTSSETKNCVDSDNNVCHNDLSLEVPVSKSASCEPFPIYATVDKSSKQTTPEPELTNINDKTGKDDRKLKPIPVAPPRVPAPLIPPKPKCLSEGFDQTSRKMSAGSEHSPELQVMMNSLSPVLTRRNSGRQRRRNGSSSETSPDNTPEISPRIPPREPKTSTNSSKAGNSSLFMDPKMAKTWHGVTSTNWSNIYGPQMRAMMKELNELSSRENGKPSEAVIESTIDEYENRCKTLPSKSLLDTMHKRFCADQYDRERDAELARSLVLFRLKNQSPLKPKRTQSFNIRMGTGKSPYLQTGAGSSSSASSESSPRFPRASERLRIKTRPDVQYSPKPPPKLRGVTPEPLQIDPDADQAELSRKEEAEIEAIEACRWLRETGFPQYAQLYEDGQFPVDIDAVEKDHDFLDKEDIQSLFRRLNTLNKCAIMKIGTPTKKECEDSDEDDQCALSDKWRYQRSSRRWSRKDLEPQYIDTRNGQPGLRSASSHDSLLADQNSSSETGDSPVLDSKLYHINDESVFKMTMPAFDANGNATMAVSPKNVRRSPSDRLKGPKSFLKRMESLKGKRGSKKPKTITEISGPVVTDNVNMQAKLKYLNCRDISSKADVKQSPAMESTVNGEKPVGLVPSSTDLIISPRHESLTVVTPQSKSDTFNSSTSDSYVQSTTHNNDSLTVKDQSKSGDAVLNDSLTVSENGALGFDVSTLSRASNSSDTTNSSQETLFMPGEYKPGKFPKLLDDSLFISDVNMRGRSYSHNDEPEEIKLRHRSHDPRQDLHRVSIYDNVPIEEDLTTAQQELDIILSELFQNINGLNKAINGDDAELLEPPSVLSLDDSSIVSIDSSSITPENELQTDNDSPTHDATSHHSHENHVPHVGSDGGDETEVVSGTLSSPDTSDHELPTEVSSHDDSAEHIVVRERRDSGVGSSLTRTNSERRKYRIRWHSFQKSHRPTSECGNLQLFNLSAGQILVLRKLSLLKLTALVEKYAPNRSGWSLTVPRFMKRHKVPDYKDKNVFGVPFHVMIQRSGQALPQCILHAMRFLRRTGSESIGIFRKSGVRSRIQKLRDSIEANPEMIDFEELQAYDVADLVKQYFRELPECLLTTKLSDIFISIFVYVPGELRTEALQAAVVLMTDENRDVLQSLLLFLSDIAKHSNKHHMTASNLAVCFAPSLFNMGGGRHPSQTPSPRRNRKNPGIPDARELMEQKAAHECLTVMIQECKKLFTIPAATLSKCRILHEDPVTLEELNSQSGDSSSNQGYMAHIDSCIQGLLKESREKFRGFVTVPTHANVDVSYKKVGDGHPLRLWKCTVDVEAPPNEVLNRVLNDRQQWDEDLLQWSCVEKLNKQTEVFQYIRNTMAPLPTRDFCVLRSWRTDLPKGACVLISTSIDHQKAELVGGLRGVELASRYLIEPCGTGKSRLTHISRVDFRGHSPEWYKKVYGHICANFMDKIRTSFHCNTEGPETKV